MEILDPGHIYQIVSGDGSEIILTFVKRSGGGVTYETEWAGIQSQSLMRCVIAHLLSLDSNDDHEEDYKLFQLGNPDPFILPLKGIEIVYELLNVLVDRSQYLNTIIPCIETRDAIAWLNGVHQAIEEWDGIEWEEDAAIPIRYATAIHAIRMALWNYEARAYRRKIEDVNRKQPQHDDTARIRLWRPMRAEDIPFNEYDPPIERRPIGEDGHIVLS